MDRQPRFSRRRILASTLSVAALATVPARAAQLISTPPQTPGPFYPRHIPLDSDADLVMVEGQPERALGEVTHIFGRILGEDDRPVSGAWVEIWQCDAKGVYHHPRDPRREGVDSGFQGYGRMVAGGDGAYRFRTIKPVPYPGRTPHIHFAVSGPGFAPLITQMYIAGHPLNDQDFVLNRIRDPRARASVMVDLKPAPDLEPGALAGRFDIVLGRRG